jgi:hypothetical protein
MNAGMHTLIAWVLLHITGMIFYPDRFVPGHDDPNAKIESFLIGVVSPIIAFGLYFTFSC